jgi:hypothetical protein
MKLKPISLKANVMFKQERYSMRFFRFAVIIIIIWICIAAPILWAVVASLLLLTILEVTS